MSVSQERTRKRAVAWLVMLLSAVFLSLNGHGQSVGTPSITPDGGIFTSNVSIALTAPDAEIRYTLDGSEPGTNSLLYTHALTLTNTTRLKARAFSGTNASELAAAVFTLAETNLFDFSSSLPLVVINTFGETIPALTNGTYWMQVLSAPTNARVNLTLPAEFSGPVNLKRRGYTSRRYPKRSLTLETLHVTGKERDVPLLGMPADSDWVLYAPYVDKTLMRDVLAYELKNQLGHYAPRTRFIEVFINESTNNLARAHYAGVYVLVERVKLAPHRVDMEKLKPQHASEPEITGGYLFLKDHLEKVGDIPASGPPRSRPPAIMARLPSGPGGFPASPAGFLPSQDLAAFSGALSIVTNKVAVTNLVNGTNIVVEPPSITVIRTNITYITNSVSITNASVVTNAIVLTNWPVATNIAVSTTNVTVTNAVVATQSVAGTNFVATTNHVDAQTAVVTTTMSITTSATYRTNYVPATNTLAITNTSLVTNMVLVTNSTLATNFVVTASPVIITNYSLVTNLFRLGLPDSNPYTEKLVSSGEGFVTSNMNAFFFVDPKPARITPAQREWLTNYLNRFEAALYGPDFLNPTNGYRAYIDVDSFIDNHLFVEATKNIDGFRFSTYFTKERGGKLKVRPIWDWNLTFGNARGRQGYLPQYWYWPQLTDQQYSWYRRLFDDPEFGQRYVDRWAQWRTNVFATSNILARINELKETLKEPAARNYERWPVLGQLVDFEYFAGKTWEEDVEYMKTWTSNRLAWIDAQFVQPPRVTGTGSALLEPVAVPSSVGDGKSPLSNSPVLLQARGNNPSVALPDALLKTGLRNTNNWSTESAVPLQPPVFP